MKVLVVEDSAFYQEVFKSFFKKMNIDHEIVDQGLYAEEALSTEDFDYVFVDLKLPDMNGWEIIADHSDLIKTKFIPMT